MHKLFSIALAATVLTVTAPACAPGPDSETTDAESSEAPAVAAMADAASSDADFVVYKSPTCGCCNGWIDHIREAGYTVEAVDIAAYAEMNAVKQGEGVPGDLGSCHTAVVEGYTIEGHVPAESIERLLRERPDIRGLAVPGMPIGSPGMEGPNPERYEVIAFTDDGDHSVFDVIDPTQDSSEPR